MLQLGAVSWRSHARIVAGRTIGQQAVRSVGVSAMPDIPSRRPSSGEIADSRRTRCVDQRLAEHADPFPEEFGALRHPVADRVGADGDDDWDRDRENRDARTRPHPTFEQ